MANRQVISPNERLALQQEDAFWTELDLVLGRQIAQQFSSLLFTVWSRNDPVHIPTDHPFTERLRDIQIQASAMADLAKMLGAGAIHWIAGHRLPNGLLLLIATQKPMRSHIDDELIDVIRGSVSVQEAIERLTLWQSHPRSDTGFDPTFQNQGFGKPMPWSYVHAYRIPDLAQMNNSASNAFPIAMGTLGVHYAGYHNIFEGVSEAYMRPRDGTQVDSAYLQTMITMLLYRHTARSMFIRGVPVAQGQRHVTANDAPSHSSLRHLIILRIRELWPDLYDECRDLLPIPIQRKLKSALTRSVITGEPVLDTDEHGMPERKRVRPAHVKIPENLVETFSYDDLARIDPKDEMSQDE